MENGKNSKKDFIMIIVVVVLAFGLTVGGIVYLTKFLLGDSSGTPAPQVVQTPPQVDSIVTISGDNSTIAVIETPEIPASAMQPQIQPTRPVTPPAATTPATTAPVTTPPASTTQAKATTPAKVAPVGNYQLQLFSLKKEESAKEQVAKYKAECPDLYVVKAELPSSGTWYRVRGCAANDKASVEAKKLVLKNKYGIDAIVVDAK